MATWSRSSSKYSKCLKATEDGSIRTPEISSDAGKAQEVPGETAQASQESDEQLDSFMHIFQKVRRQMQRQSDWMATRPRGPCENCLVSRVYTCNYDGVRCSPCVQRRRACSRFATFVRETTMEEMNIEEREYWKLLEEYNARRASQNMRPALLMKESQGREKTARLSKTKGAPVSASFSSKRYTASAKGKEEAQEINQSAFSQSSSEDNDESLPSKKWHGLRQSARSILSPDSYILSSRSHQLDHSALSPLEISFPKLPSQDALHNEELECAVPARHQSTKVEKEDALHDAHQRLSLYESLNASLQAQLVEKSRVQEERVAFNRRRMERYEAQISSLRIELEELREQNRDADSRLSRLLDEHFSRFRESLVWPAEILSENSSALEPCGDSNLKRLRKEGDSHSERSPKRQRKETMDTDPANPQDDRRATCILQ